MRVNIVMRQYALSVMPVVPLCIICHATMLLFPFFSVSVGCCSRGRLAAVLDDTDGCCRRRLVVVLDGTVCTVIEW